VESVDETSSRLSRFRAKLDFSMAGSSVPTSEGIAMPKVPSVGQDPGVTPSHPPAVVIDDDDFLLGSGVFRITLRSVSDPRAWVVLAAADELPAATVPGLQYRFPAVDAKPFRTPGSFLVTVEAIEMPAGAFDFDAFVLSDLEREHRRLARSATVPLSTTP
jgi:hypothetical protein